MTQEDKDLLLKDLCARLPYGVKINIYDDYSGTMKVEDLNVFYLNGTYYIEYNKLQPYLRQLSSITEEEFKEYHSMLIDIDNSGLMNQELITKIVDWLDRKMFDHRNLIPKGLALEAPKDMYKTE